MFLPRSPAMYRPGLSFVRGEIGGRRGLWARSSNGRAAALQAGDKEFDPLRVHYYGMWRKLVAQQSLKLLILVQIQASQPPAFGEMVQG